MAIVIVAVVVFFIPFVVAVAPPNQELLWQGKFFNYAKQTEATREKLISAK